MEFVSTERSTIIEEPIGLLMRNIRKEGNEINTVTSLWT